MKCVEARDQLLEAIDPHPSRCGGDLAVHLHQCPACRQFALDLAGVACDLRDPIHEAAVASRDRFLARLSRPEPRRNSSRLGIGVAIAASLLFALTLTYALVSSENQPGGSAKDVAHATDPAAQAVIAALVDWNVRLNELPSPQERDQLYQEKASVFREQLLSTQMTPHDQLLANDLLSHAAWLSTNDDPLDQAERFQVVADTLWVRLETTANAGGDDAAKVLAQMHEKVSSSVVGKMKQAEKLTKDEKRKQRMLAMEKRMQAQAERAAALAARLAETSKKQQNKEARQKKQANKL